MANKYELYRQERGLWRIRALKDFSGVREGELGGLVATERNLSQSGNCWIFGNARVDGNAMVEGDATVKNDAHVTGYAKIGGSAEVVGSALVDGFARVYGSAHVTGGATVSGRAVVGGYAIVTGSAKVGDYARITGSALVLGSAVVEGRAKIDSGTYEKGVVKNSAAGAASANAVVNAAIQAARNRNGKDKVASNGAPLADAKDMENDIKESAKECMGSARDHAMHEIERFKVETTRIYKAAQFRGYNDIVKFYRAMYDRVAKTLNKVARDIDSARNF